MDAQIAADQPRADREILVAPPLARGRLDADAVGGRALSAQRGHREITVGGEPGDRVGDRLRAPAAAA